MANIVAGRFEQQTDADAAIAELTRQGFARDEVTSFFVNPPGEHAKFLIGGALGKMEDAPADRPYAETPPEVRHAGIVVAAHVPEPEQRASALEVLQASGAKDIETAEGHWRDGEWTDFDPAAPPGAEVGGPLAGDARPQRIRK